MASCLLAFLSVYSSLPPTRHLPLNRATGKGYKSGAHTVITLIYTVDLKLHSNSRLGQGVLEGPDRLSVTYCAVYGLSMLRTWD